MPRLVIRVNSKQSSEPDELQATREIVEYHWHRIIAVVLVGVLLIGVVAWLTYRWLSTPAEKISGQLPAGEVFQQNGHESPPVELPQAESSQTKRPQQPEPTPERSSAADNASPTGMTAKSGTPKISAPEITAAPTARPAEKDLSTDAKAGTIPETAQENATPAKVVMHSGHVKRAQLTSNVVNDAPVDQLNSVIPMNQQGLLRIYLFTETSGLQNRNLFHYWYRDGKQMAKVRMPTSRRPIIASSSKFIDRYMTGQWEVKVMDDRRNLLATARFTVTP